MPHLSAPASTSTDGTHLMLREPTGVGRTLLGTLDDQDAIRVTLPLSEVHSVAVGKFSIGKTLRVVGGAFGVVAVAWLTDCRGHSGGDAIGRH